MEVPPIRLILTDGERSFRLATFEEALPHAFSGRASCRVGSRSSWRKRQAFSKGSGVESAIERDEQHALAGAVSPHMRRGGELHRVAGAQGVAEKKPRAVFAISGKNSTT